MLKTKPSRQAVKAVSCAANEILVKTNSTPRYAQYLGYHRDRLALDYDWVQQTSQKNEKICEFGAYPFFLTRALVEPGLYGGGVLHDILHVATRDDESVPHAHTLPHLY